MEREIVRRFFYGNSADLRTPTSCMIYASDNPPVVNVNSQDAPFKHNCQTDSLVSVFQSGPLIISSLFDDGTHRRGKPDQETSSPYSQ